MRAFERIRNDRRIPKNYQEDSLHVTEIIKALLDDADSTVDSLDEFSGPELWDALKILIKIQNDVRLPGEVRTDKQVDDMIRIIRELIDEKKFLENIDGNNLPAGSNQDPAGYSQDPTYNPDLASSGSNGTHDPKRDSDNDDSNDKTGPAGLGGLNEDGSSTGTSSDGATKDGGPASQEENKTNPTDQP